MKDESHRHIRVLGEKDKISEPGFYRIPMERHHGQPCDGVSVTSSILRTMELQTPADVWAFHALNPDRWERDDKPAFRQGRAIAALIEGGLEALHEQFIILPVDKPNRPTAQQIKAYDEGRATDAGMRSVNFWRKIESNPRDILKPEDLELIVSMGKVLAKDVAACAALAGEPEITMAWYDDETDLWCLSRPDQLSFSGMLSDYKKMATRGEPFNHRLVDRRITAHGYDMQMAFAAEGFQELTREWPTAVGLVCQCDAKPHHVILRPITDEDLEIGIFRNRRGRMRFRECLDSGLWPGPGDDVGAYRRPEWQRTALIEQMDAVGVTV